MQLTTGGTLNGKAGTATAVTYTITGDRKTTTDSYETLGQGQLALATGALLTTSPVAASTQLLIAEILLNNTTASPIVVTLYVNGTAATNQIYQATIPANGTITYSKGQWTVYDASGAVQFVGNTGATGPTGPTGPTGSTGPTGPTGAVATVTNADGTITVTGTGTNPVVSRTAITGPITIAGGANATVIGATAADGATLEVSSGALREKDGGTTLAKMANLAQKTVIGRANGAGTGVPQALTPTQLAAIPDAATTTLQGMMTAANYKSVNNYFNYTVFLVDDYGVTPGGTAAANVTAMNALLSSAPDGAILQFGPYTYQFNAALSTLTKDFCIQGVYGQTTIAITADMGASTAFIKMWNSGFYSCVQNLNFVNFATQTSSNYVIAGNNNAVPQIINCFFSGAAQWAGLLDFTGTSSGVGATIRNMYASQWSGKAINVVSPLDTLYLEDTLFIGAGISGQIGLYCSDGGAILMTNCQMISCDVNVKLDPANGKTVSAVFAVNCFFDQGKTNCLLITGAGTGTVARCHFIACWFTIAGTASAGGVGSNTKCIQITTAGTGIHSGIQFQDCEIMNATTGSTGTLEGILATSVQDFTVMGCQFAGWTNDIQITPASAGTCQPQIAMNDFSSWGLVTGSANNVILNVGSPTTYGQMSIIGNVFGGTTTKLIDNSTIAVGSQKLITANVGLAQPGIDVVAFQTTTPNLTASAANLIAGTSIRIPTNGLRVGSRIRFVLGIQKTAAGAATWIAAVKFGTANTTADTAICSFTSGTNTAAADGANLTIDVRITAVGSGTSATCVAQAVYNHSLLAATGLGSLGPATTSTTGFNSTLADPYFHIDITPGAVAVMTAMGTAEVQI